MVAIWVVIPQILSLQEKREFNFSTFLPSVPSSSLLTFQSFIPEFVQMIQINFKNLTQCCTQMKCFIKALFAVLYSLTNHSFRFLVYAGCCSRDLGDT